VKEELYTLPRQSKGYLCCSLYVFTFTVFQSCYVVVVVVVVVGGDNQSVAILEYLQEDQFSGPQRKKLSFFQPSCQLCLVHCFTTSAQKISAFKILKPWLNCSTCFPKPTFYMPLN